MAQKIFAISALALALGACGQAEHAPNEAETKTTSSIAEAKKESPVIGTYVKIRKMAAVGDIEGASQLTDDPAAYLEQMRVALERIGQETFSKNMKNAALTINIDSEKRAGDFAMLIINFSFKGQNEKVANFFKKDGDRFVEIVNPDDKIPCQLVKDFFDAKGDTESAIQNCSESTAS